MRSWRGPLASGITEGMHPNQIGSYPVLRLLGEGATGLVYAGQDPALQREVAIKVLKPGVGESVEQRFVREGRLLARLRHPGIVGVHGVGLQAGRPYLVMDLLVGSSLEERLAQHGAYTWGEAVELASAIAEALSYAHRMGVLHRDLKPENVVLDAEGRPILTDFGLGKAIDSTTQVSVEGALLGTPAYWAPEQARGDLNAIGPATDVYGVGGILYALLTGEGPNRGMSLAELVTSMQVLPPAPSGEAPGELPSALDAICLRALARSPRDRYASMAELSADLRELTLVQGGSRAPWILAVVATVAALGLGGALLAAPRERTKSPAPTPTLAATPSAVASPTPVATPSSTPPPGPAPSPSPAALTPSSAPLTEAQAQPMELRLRKLTQAGDVEGALALAEELVRRAPTRPYGHAIRSSVLSQQGRGGEAFAGYVAADLATPDQPAIELGMIGAGIRLEEDYLPRLERLVRHPQARLRGAALLTRATLYHSRGAFYLAINDYRAYLRLERKDTAVREKYALALFDAREFAALREVIPELRATSQGSYLFVLGDLAGAGKVLSQGRDPEARLMRAASGGRQLSSRVPAGFNRYTAPIYRFLAGLDSAESLVAAMGKDALRLCQAHFYIGLDALTRGDLTLAQQHFAAAQAKSTIPSLERSLSRWYGTRLRPDTSPFRIEASPLDHASRLRAQAGGREQPPTASAFESDLLLELYPSDPSLLTLNARNTWGLRAGIALSRLAHVSASAKGAQRAKALQDLGFCQITLKRWGEAERTFDRLLKLEPTPLARAGRGTTLLAQRRIPEALADLEAASLGAAESLRVEFGSTLASAYLLARRDDLALEAYGLAADPREVAANLVLAGWVLGREKVWKAQFKGLKPGLVRDLWAHALGLVPPPASARAWVQYVQGKSTWVEAGLTLRPPGATPYRVAAGIYFATRGAEGKAREQFKLALQKPDQASTDTVVASRWLMDHPE